MYRRFTREGNPFGTGALTRASAAACLILLSAVPLAAQERSAAAFGIEAAGGVAGSLLGFVAVSALLDDDGCGDDIRCGLGRASTAVLVSTLSSGVGAYGAGRMAETNPSGFGAAVGAVAGAAAGLGMWHLLSEELNLITDDGTGILIYSLTQGVITAAGSRIVRALR